MAFLRGTKKKHPFICIAERMLDAVGKIARMAYFFCEKKYVANIKTRTATRPKSIENEASTMAPNLFSASCDLEI